MAVIDYRRRFVLVHNPKSGGQAIMKALGAEKCKNVGHHAPHHQIPDADKLFSFGFVRNPWDRMVSLYAFMTQKVMRPSDFFDQDELRRMGFKKWLLEWDFSREALQRRHVQQLGLRKSQIWWLDGCSFIGQFESLQDDFDLICDKIGVARRPVPHINASKRPHYREFYDRETAAAVTKWHLPEIEVFGYEFEG